MLLLFVLQHSLMASDCWKSLLSTLHLKVVERPIYVIATAYALQVGMAGSATGRTYGCTNRFIIILRNLDMVYIEMTFISSKRTLVKHVPQRTYMS